MLQRKIIPPGLPATAIARPRLDALYAALLDDHEALAVFATAGSGKTIQAQLFATREGWPLAWLTLDRADRSASRMLSYLGRALRPHAAGVDDILESAYASDPMPEVVGALLAEAIDAPRVLVVFDQCEAIADSAPTCSAIEAFLEYLPDGARALLLSREEMNLSLGRLLLQGRVGRVTDDVLAVTADEAELFMRARGDETDVDACLDRTGGWIAAVAFGASSGPGGEGITRDFRSYVAAEVFDVLEPEEQRFLLDTSILDAVSLRAATALCGPEGGTVWRRLGLRHLPATTSTDGTVVYHPCFRNFLRERLELEDPKRLELLRRAHANLLLETAQDEDAADLFFELGMVERALEAVERACGQLVDRCDWETVLRWADALGAERVMGSPGVAGAVIAALRGARRLEEARTLVRRLDDSGALAAVLATDDRVITHVAWTMLWQPREGLELLDRYDADRRAVGVRYMLEVTSGSEPVDPPSGLCWTGADRLVSWALMVQGRLTELVEMLPSEDQWPPRTPYTTPHPLLGLVWRGELGRARELFDQVPEEVRQRIHTDVWHYLESWLLLAEGDAAGALVASQRAVAHSRRTGFGFEPVFQVVESEALLSLGRVHDAVTVLRGSIESSRASGLRAYEEWGHTALGSALLRQNDDEGAEALLRTCIESMSRARRLLLLPAAAMYLAEARWRLGRDDDALAAADLAYDTSVEMGTFSVLQRALAQFPEVYERLLECHPDATRWRRAAVSATTSAATPGPGSEETRDSIFVVVQPFGTSPDIVVNGTAVGCRRLKMLELACLLANRPGGVVRDEILLQLFPQSDRRRASNHFRQVVHQLRKSAGLTLQRLPGSRIAWSSTLVVDTVDRQFERALAEANVLAGEARLTRMREALEMVDGPYLESSELEWVNDRRFELDVLQEEAELETARLALDVHDFDLARDLSERLLARNPYSEAAYRVLIEVDLAVGTETSALATYRRAVAALREIGLEPEEATAQVLTSQKRRGGRSDGPSPLVDSR